MYKNTNVRLQAHKGCSFDAPENTMASYELAVKLGYEFIELDPKVTSDLVPVLIHDRTLNRTARKIDGCSYDEEIKVSDLTFDELQKFDVGLHKDEEFRGEKVPKFYDALKEKTAFDKDERIKFVGTVYEQYLLTKIRENAYCYIHGHEVGGTNPSLLEALATTNLNLLYEVSFNKEVAKDSAMYWNKEENNLSNLINKIDEISKEEIDDYGIKAKERIKEEYNWQKIVKQYEKIF